ncbi:MAG: hypothetical protein ACKVVP_15270 [Chloroflexota bacterium]
MTDCGCNVFPASLGLVAFRSDISVDGSIVTNGMVTALGTVQSIQGDVKALGGHVTGQLSVTSAGYIHAATHVTAGQHIVANTGYVHAAQALLTTGYVQTNGNVPAGAYVLATLGVVSTGSVQSTQGNILAPLGYVHAGTHVTAVQNIQAGGTVRGDQHVSSGGTLHVESTVGMGTPPPTLPRRLQVQGDSLVNGLLSAENLNTTGNHAYIYGDGKIEATSLSVRPYSGGAGAPVFGVNAVGQVTAASLATAGVVSGGIVTTINHGNVSAHGNGAFYAGSKKVADSNGCYYA